MTAITSTEYGYTVEATYKGKAICLGAGENFRDAEACVAGLEAGHAPADAIREGHAILSGTEAATPAQMKYVRHLLATADLQDLEGSVRIPRLVEMTKADASWIIDQLA